MRFDEQAGGDANLAELYADVAGAGLQPLWLQRGLLPTSPDRLSPHLWRWKTLRALATRSGELVGIDRGGDRRVLSLSHPDLGGLPFATHTLWGGIQYLNPGEFAPAHRHSPAALRFVLEGTGVWTLVNGDPIAMEPGDLVLTPSYCWHEHHNSGDTPMIWFDGLDLPLIRSLDAVFYEDGPEELADYVPTKTSHSEAVFGAAGLRPTNFDPYSLTPSNGQHSPLLVYRWADVDRTLTHLANGQHRGSVSVRYTDPLTGDDIMPTLRAEMHRIIPSARTASTRSVGSQLWVVRSGRGTSVIAGRRFDWQAGDVFVVPSWAPVDHQSTESADLFMMSDEPVIEAVGLGRREELGQHQPIDAHTDPVVTGSTP